jgi:hypothetical protein
MKHFSQKQKKTPKTNKTKIRFDYLNIYNQKEEA